ncbi:hypothetical protein HMP0721_1914 [Pseudoramibacter alactolyticus ATCC 23263]|uniref:Uncharacterized protein n=1 Tax=Pseudoramibacter alactolyticus ATCC 23263 TaxID=887929 RepID=E6MIS9_9FIRM|nr:hypothetical protein HMP0721_1914 [Pseudoramibacter alactolyticus ATCC 23263]
MQEILTQAQKYLFYAAKFIFTDLRQIECDFWQSMHHENLYNRKCKGSMIRQCERLVQIFYLLRGERKVEYCNSDSKHR